MRGETIKNGKLMIRFKIAIFSELNTEIAKFTVIKATKKDAEKTVEKWLAINDPHRIFTYKIS